VASADAFESLWVSFGRFVITQAVRNAMSIPANKGGRRRVKVTIPSGSVRHLIELVMSIQVFGVAVSVDPGRQSAAEVAGGGVECYLEEFCFVLGCGDACEGPDLGVGDVACFERVRGGGQSGELAADANPLACRGGFDVGDGGEPVSWRG